MTTFVTTKHDQIGYVANLEIIEDALRNNFDLQDQSYLTRAISAHIWSQVCQTIGEYKTWGRVEIDAALGAIMLRLLAIQNQQSNKPKP